MKTFGESIAEGRRSKKVTLRKLGELTGISPSYLSEIENGIKPPPKDTEIVKNLAIVLGLNFSQLSASALMERAAGKASDVFAKLFGPDNKLAVSFYREDRTEEEINELREKIKKVIDDWEGKYHNDEEERNE